MSLTNEDKFVVVDIVKSEVKLIILKGVIILTLILILEIMIRGLI